MARIVIAGPLGLFPDQRSRLKKLATTRFFDSEAKTPEEWLARCRNADIICTGKFGLKDKIYELHDVFLSFPFVGVGWLDRKRMRARNITASFAPGCNKDAVSEWIIAMMLLLSRDFLRVINAHRVEVRSTLGLAGKTVCVIGPGHIGSRVARICEALDMRVQSVGRGEPLTKAEDADFVVDTAGHTPQTEGMYDRKFFFSLKRGSFFITVTSQKLWDTDAMLAALDAGILAGAANDCGSGFAGDTRDAVYRRLSAHPRVLATPHVSYDTDVTNRVANDMMLDHVEAWLHGKPRNLL